MNRSLFELFWALIPLELFHTVYMVSASLLIAILLGFPIGVLLTISKKGHLKENMWLYKVLGTVVNVGRSFPFAILIIVLIPFTRLIVGTSLGTTASIVPLSIAAAPFIARIVESAFAEVDIALIEAAKVMGSSTKQIIRNVLIPESMPSLVSGITLTAINLIGYSTMAGLIGGGGLGQVAIQYGYQRFNLPIMIITVALLILLVQTVQWIGNKIILSIQLKRGYIRYE